MCVAHGKRINDWFYNKETIGLIEALANDLGLEVNYQNSGNSSVASISAAYPQLVVVKRGSPANGGGVWLHPDLAIQLAQWCNPFFAIQVSRWVRDWLSILEQERRAEEEKRNEWRAIKACVLPGSVAIAAYPIELGKASDPCFVHSLIHQGQLIGILAHGANFTFRILSSGSLLEESSDYYADLGAALNAALAQVEKDVRWQAGFQSYERGEPFP